MVVEDNQIRHTKDFDAMLNIVIFNSFGFFFIGFVMPIVARLNMGASGLEIGIIVSVQVIGRMLSSSIIGYITDKTKSRGKLILIGSFGRGFSYLVLYGAIITNSLISLWVGSFFLGFCAGFFWVPFDTLIAEKSNKNHRSHAYGKRNSSNAKGQIIGGVVGFSLLTIFSLFTDEPIILYIIIPLFGFSNFYAGIKFVRNVDDSIKFSDPISVGQVPTSKEMLSKQLILGTLFLMIAILLASVNNSISRPFLNVYLLENIESNIFLATMSYLPAGLFATFLAPKLGVLVDKLRPSLGITITSLLGALITWFLINTNNILMFAVLLVFDMTIQISAGLILQNLMSRITLEHRGKIMGINSFIGSFGSVIGPIYGGIVWDNLGPKSPFTVSIFVELLLIPIFLLVVFLLLPYLTESYDKSKSNN